MIADSVNQLAKSLQILSLLAVDAFAIGVHRRIVDARRTA
jgi:hypothetical protein